MDKEKDPNKGPTRYVPTKQRFTCPCHSDNHARRWKHTKHLTGKRTFPPSVTAIMATDAASLSQVVCDCGSDHQGSSTRRCPIFEILSRLQLPTEDLLQILDSLEFGKNGPMAHRLRSVALRYYDSGIDEFEKWQAMSEENPNWNLADSISRSRRHYDQISITCAEDKRTLGPHPSPLILPVIVGDEEKTLKKAKQAVIWLYQYCADFISEHMRRLGVLPIRPENDEHGYLWQIDCSFEEAMDAINSTVKPENATLQDLSNKSCRIWRETRRLMCEHQLPFDNPLLGTRISDGVIIASLTDSNAIAAR